MNVLQVTVNHHADHPGFAGAAGLLCAVVFLAKERANARPAVDIASVAATDRVVDIGCGPGVAVKAAARRGARERASTRHRSCCGWLGR